VQVPLIADERDSLAAKVEALRVYLEQQMGLEPFLSLYRYMESFTIDEDPHIAADTIMQMVGENVRFIPMVHQLIASEEVVLAQGNAPNASLETA
jgi:NIMA (never in mitosis gene a)-related kinase 1/4/5